MARVTGVITGRLWTEYIQGFFGSILFGIIDVIAVVPELSRILPPLDRGDAGPSRATT